MIKAHMLLQSNVRGYTQVHNQILAHVFLTQSAIE